MSAQPVPGRCPRVVVADDSALMRRLVRDVLTRGGVHVVGTARNGDEALELCRRLQPDAMTLDLSMPGMGGIEVLRELRGSGPRVPVVVVSAFSPAQGAYAVDALAEGAFDLVTKPTDPGDLGTFENSLLTRLTLAAASRPQSPAPPTRLPRRPTHGSRWAATAPIIPTGSPAPNRPAAATPRRAPAPGPKLVLIAISTGGPRALAELLPALPARLGLGTLIVQHMPAGFTSSLAARLDRGSALTVREAGEAELPDPGVALLAPGGRHLRLAENGRTVLDDSEPIGGLRPRADPLIEDAAARFGERLLLVVMTGMGSDGLAGAQAVRRAGGRILAEAEESCTVYGMPRAVADADLVDKVVPLRGLAEAIVEEMSA